MTQNPSSTPKPDEQPTAAPSITLPKGGGAIKGIGEKFAANPVTGTGSMTVPIATSPGRGGFGPQLSLSYDSGSGNGPFGFGWDLSLPAITRKTDKGLPQYHNAEESDIFILSGAEDLVPVLRPDGARFEDDTTAPGYVIHRYCPRMEGLFARIERWTDTATGAIHWRSITRDNVTTLYGKDNGSRILDPADPDPAHPTRIFSWLICESYDDQGNAIVYEYAAENADNIDRGQANERNRLRTANRYLKRIKYGNRVSRLVQPDRALAEWMFEVVFDYGEGHYEEVDLDPARPEAEQHRFVRASASPDLPWDASQRGWEARPDPFSFHRPSFEVRTYRRCRRVLMFHHIPDLPTGEQGYDGLVRSTEFDYADLDYAQPVPIEAELAHPGSTRFASFVRRIIQSGYVKDDTQAPFVRNGVQYATYRQQSLPPLEFEYTKAQIQDEVKELDEGSRENLPVGIDGANYQWVDLDGEGISGILAKQGVAWHYKPNQGGGKFGATQTLRTQPSLFAVAAGGEQLIDLSGDGQLDVAAFSGPTPGFYERTHDYDWEPFRSFRQLPNIPWDAPNLRFVDLNGDGHADVLITEHEVFTWYPSLEEEGFGPAHQVRKHWDEEAGPRLVLADGTQSIYLADMSGDGLTDLVRLRNGEVSYWPNLGYGRFGAKVAMDNAPWFDHPDQFDQGRIRLADIDGSGTNDIIYLGSDGVRLYFNQSGNGWSEERRLPQFPKIDNLTSVTTADLLGNGTACLVWSSPLSGDARRPLRYIDLMGGLKPHLLTKSVNNLGAETHVEYAPSTKFYLTDKLAGKPWVTRIPFPVHVVERVETYDHISRNCFVTRYAYHHGYFDSVEREFRGFGMVEQWDSEHSTVAGQASPPKYEIGQVATAIIQGAWQFSFRPIINIKPSMCPDRGWFYFFEGINSGFHEDDVLLLKDAGEHASGSVWDGTPEGESIVLTDDASATNIDEASHVPPVLTKTWFHTGVYDEVEEISQHFAAEYYGAPEKSDPNYDAAFAAFFQTLLPDTVIPPNLTPEEEREACRALKGSMLRQEVYADDAGPDATAAQIQRARTPYTVTEQNFTIRTLQLRGANRQGVFFTHARESISYHYERNPADPRIQHALTLEVDDFGNVLKQAAIGYGRRASPLSTQWDRDRQTTALLTYTENRVTNAIETSDTYRTPLPCEALTFELTGYTPTGAAGRFQASDLVEPDPATAGRLRHKFTDQVPYEAPATGNPCRRPIEWLRTLYRRDDLSGLLPLGELHALALPGESYKLAFTPGLLTQVYQRSHGGQPAEPLLPNPAAVLGGQAGNQGGYLRSQTLKADGRFPATDADDHWWIPAGQSFFTTNPLDAAATELAQARQHFFLPRRYRDPFGQDAFVDFDGNDLLMVETRDALDNRVTVNANDYRVLQPRLVSDPNRNQTEVAFDTLGMVVGTAVMGKPLPAPVEGDTLTGFVADLTQTQLDGFFNAADPHATATVLLKDATTRIVYDLDRFWRTQQANPNDPTKWQPACAATLTRETHVSSLLPSRGLKIQLSFSYSDGFGREIQKKIQAEPGPLDVNDPQAPVVSPRWVGSGWTIFNNKGKPVRQYEPFFSATHCFEFNAIHGVSPVLFYDPAERVIATLHPNHTYEKVVFDPWQQTTYDVNDTCARRNRETGDPRTDPDIQGYVAEYFKTQLAIWQTWHAQRISGAMGPDESNAAQRTAAHADTPTTAHFDTLGRPFLTVARNRVVCVGHDLDGTEDSFATRVELDIEGNQRAVRDERKLPVNHLPNGALEQRIVMRYAYDMLGNRIHQISMEAGARWMLNDVAGKPIRAWDSRGHNFTTNYDALRRPVEQTVRGTTTDSDPRTFNRDILADRIEYGEGIANAEALNLRTRIYQHFDSAGVATNARLDANGNPTGAYDFKGNLLRSTRRLVSDYTAIPDWLLNPQLDAETFEGSTCYDALNRPVQSIAPHSSLTRPGHPNKFNVIQPVFNEANLLERVDVWLERATEPAGLLDPAAEAASPVGVADIDYDAKGQRTLIDYKTRDATVIRTAYAYDRETYRLTHLYTRRGVNPATAQGVAFTDDCENPNPPPATIAAPAQPPAGKGCGLQNLHYTYDPAGNITHIRDDAQQTVYFHNRRVEPSNDYIYDALYRLIQADGREHLGQAAGGVRLPPTAPDGFNAFHTRLDHPGDGNAMGTYIERYVYDAVGNFLQMQHRGSDPAHPGWTRAYTYAEVSLTEPGKQSNRLTGMQVGNGVASAPETYLHDTHGNMLRMPHLGGGGAGPNMHWDYKDQLRQIDKGGGGAAFYVYDASGQRVRKVWEKAPGLTEERIYLGGFEIFRSHGGPIGVNTATLERETLHVIDVKQRIALVETRTLDTAGDDQATQNLIRYQFGNHLGSTSLEVDERAQIISYEEYAPYGSSTYQAMRSQTETAKRYRYTGKERDEESGFYYHGARHYAAWLGRWLSSDPIGIADGVNTFAYCRSNPLNNTDPTGRGTEGERQIYCKAKSEGFIKEHWMEHRTFKEMASKEGWSLPKSAENYLYEHTQTSLSDKRFSQTIKTPSDAQLGRGVASGEVPPKEALARSVAKNQAELTAAGKSAAIRNTAAELQMAQAHGRVAGVLKLRENMKAGLEGRRLYRGVNDAIRGAEQRYLASLSKSSSPQVVPAAQPTVIVDPSLQTDASSDSAKPSRKGRLLGRTMQVAGGAALAGDVLVKLHEGRPVEAAVTAAVGGGAMFVLSKVPALAPLAVMASSIQASKDPTIQRHAFSAGDWVAERTHPVVGAMAAAGVATGESVFEGTFGVTGRAIGEGAAVVYIRATSDEYTFVPWKSQLWAGWFGD